MKKSIITIIIYVVSVIMFVNVRDYFEKKELEAKIRNSLYSAVQEYKNEYLDEYGRYDWDKAMQRQFGN